MFKAISITLPEIMIQKLDKMLLNSQFASRSDFFRHLVRLWQFQGDIGVVKASPFSVSHSGADGEQEASEATEGAENEFANVDCEFGIPAEVVERIIEISKLET